MEEKKYTAEEARDIIKRFVDDVAEFPKEVAVFFLSGVPDGDSKLISNDVVSGSIKILATIIYKAAQENNTVSHILSAVSEALCVAEEMRDTETKDSIAS